MGDPMTTAPSRTVAVINNKGGVGKTTTVANLAGQFAAGGVKVLAVDLDPQGHLGIPLGYYGTEDADQGKRIVDAIQDDEPLEPPVANVRPNLDVYPGGTRLRRLQGIEWSGEIPEGVVRSFADKLEVVAADYDMVLLDCPPGEPLIQQMALGASKYVLAPIDTGVGATNALRDHLAPMVTRARRENPGLTYLGAFLCRHPSRATRVLRNTRFRLDEFSEFVPVFQSIIRSVEAPASDSERLGQLVHELAGELPNNHRAYLEALRDPERTGEVKVERISDTVSDLAQDYHHLGMEMVRMIASHEKTAPIRKAIK
jgi:chromosome partitioning protein